MSPAQAADEGVRRRSARGAARMLRPYLAQDDGSTRGSTPPVLGERESTPEPEMRAMFGLRPRLGARGRARRCR